MSKSKLLLIAVITVALAAIWVASAYAGDPSPPGVNGLISCLF